MYYLHSCDSDTNANARCDANADTDANSRSDADTDANPGADTNSDANAGTDTDAIANANSADPDTDSEPDADPDTDSKSEPESYTGFLRCTFKYDLDRDPEQWKREPISVEYSGFRCRWNCDEGDGYAQHFLAHIP